MITRVLFTMHDGKRVIADVENYNAIEIKNDLNNRETGEFVAYGDKGFSKYTVKYYEPLDEVVENEENNA